MKLDQWLTSIYQDEQEKTAAADLDTLMESLPIEEVMKLAGIDQKETAQDPPKQGNDPDLQKLTFFDKIARQLAHTHSEVVKEAKCKSSEYGMEKEDAFTTPEAKAKAKVMSRAMKMSKGAPAKVRKAAVQMTGKEVSKTARSKNVTQRIAELTSRYGFGRAGSRVPERVKRVATRGEARIHGWMKEKGLGRKAREASRD